MRIVQLVELSHFYDGSVLLGSIAPVDLGQLNLYLVAPPLTSSFSFEVLVVSDGSTDDTFIEVERYSQKLGTDAVRLLELASNQGKGAAVRKVNTSCSSCEPRCLSRPSNVFPPLCGIIVIIDRIHKRSYRLGWLSPCMKYNCCGQRQVKYLCRGTRAMS